MINESESKEEYELACRIFDETFSKDRVITRYILAFNLTEAEAKRMYDVMADTDGIVDVLSAAVNESKT